MRNEIKLAIFVSIFCSVLVGCAATSPAPVSSIKKDYNSIERGSYKGSFYEVQKGDTLYFIAYVTDKNVNDLVSYNGLSAPYTIRPGQKLKLWQPAYKSPAYGGSGSGSSAVAVASVTTASTVTGGASVASVSEAKSTPQSAKKSSANTQKSTSNNSNSSKTSNKNGVDQSKSKEYVNSKSKQNVNKTVSTPESKNNKISKWLWPTKGRVIKKFSTGDQGNKGIDIAGQRGQSVVSTASGKVVYSGNALRGYGNLIIVKHNDNYLSAYAHNDRLLVSEGQSVKAGQKIATMGSSGSNNVKLHFEIRYQGKSVNPQRYLP
ncbi:peptidoglycan DD-metalloendopeptidase family protein [Vibrio algarum]|uniref:Peptidoglycan DD-metalloendopeptidase family protein n=1 Tax=Vibrio algarum TaxID=3020714 RepID=A0ABT4YV22_9VIBR|nr:peptidoglycan DD-metalloendopeptidase family protein [Vibrio sp. KJ40-1]MDB1124858.1 peptidoglycan DD-metalloendopeptidase family protein [Vibrio sp. KJ40-1]